MLFTTKESIFRYWIIFIIWQIFRNTENYRTIEVFCRILNKLEKVDVNLFGKHGSLLETEVTFSQKTPKVFYLQKKTAYRKTNLARKEAKMCFFRNQKTACKIIGATFIQLWQRRFFTHDAKEFALRRRKYYTTLRIHQ